MWYLLLLLIAGQCSAYEVVYAVNCGGEREFVDSRGIFGALFRTRRISFLTFISLHIGIIYEEDPLREGLTSNYGSRYAIDRVPPEDAPLYQTERYNFQFLLQLHLKMAGLSSSSSSPGTRRRPLATQSH